MKTLIATLLTLLSLNAAAAEITSGLYDKSSDSIVLNVIYQGGCKEHNFQVQIEMCNRTVPATCTAKLIDRTEDDVCRGYVQKTVRISAEKAIGSMSIDQLLIKAENETSVLIDLF